MKYTKRIADTIDAFIWTGGPDQEEDPEWICEAIRLGTVFFRPGYMYIRTPGGAVCVKPGDYVMRMRNGEITSRDKEGFQSFYVPYHAKEAAHE